MIPLASPGSVYFATVAYENNKNHFQFAARVTNNCSPSTVDQTCSAKPSARNYGCSAAKEFAAGGGWQAAYPEVPSAPPGAELGDKVLTVGGIGGAGVTTTANVVVGTKTAPGVARLRAGPEGEWTRRIICCSVVDEKEDAKTERRREE